MSQLYTITVPAGGVTNQAVTGRELFIKDASGALSVDYGDGKTPTARGSLLRSEKLFTWITFFNDNAADITVSYYCGESVPQDLLSSETMPASTKLAANGGDAGTALLNADNNLELDHTEYVTLNGTDSTGRRRRQIVITNLSASLDLTIKKAAASARRAATVFPRTAWTLETDADLCVVNLSGSDGLVCQVLETFYTETEDTSA